MMSQNQLKLFLTKKMKNKLINIKTLTMKTQKSILKLGIVLFSLAIAQQVNSQKTILQEWDFEKNTQSNNGIEFGWPNNDSGKVSNGCYKISGANATSSLIDFADVSSGKITYSVTLKAWELSNAASAFWGLVFYDSNGDQVSKHKIISQKKTGYFATALYTQYRENNDVFTTDFKAGKLNNWHANTGDMNNSGKGSYGYNRGKLPITINFTMDIDSEFATYNVWVGDIDASQDNGRSWGRYGTNVYSGSIDFDRTISKLRWQWKTISDASNAGDEFIEIDKITIYKEK